MDQDIGNCSNDSVSSETTILIKEEDINSILQKHTSKPSSLPDESTCGKRPKNIYNLDEFSDIEEDYIPLETRLLNKSKENHSSWTNKFSAEDFCDNSNDFDAFLKNSAQWQSEQPTQGTSKEVETLIYGDMIQNPQNKKNDSDSLSEASNSFDLQLELDKIKAQVVLNLTDESKEGFFSSRENVDSDNILEPKPKKSRKRGDGSENTNNVDKKTEKELARAAKAKEREQKQLEKENQKQLKNALRVVENSAKPDQCTQYLTVNIDENLQEKPYGEVIVTLLKTKGYNYKITKQSVNNLISFTRKIPVVENKDLQMFYKDEKHCVVVIEITEFLYFINEDSLIAHIQSLLSTPQVGHLSVAILGLQRYYKYLKDERSRIFKAAVTEPTTSKNIKTTEFENMPKITKQQIEDQLVQMQIFCKHLYVRPVDRYEDLAMFIGECTKSVAQNPYKAAKAESFEAENELFAVNNRDCVRVDKDGNGLNRLWHQFLRMFPLASLETAEAIASVYPTLHCLMEAYKNCTSPESGEKLLQDIPVRRAAGPLSGQRKLGPELSKKVYKVFTSPENILI